MWQSAAAGELQTVLRSSAPAYTGYAWAVLRSVLLATMCLLLLLLPLLMTSWGYGPELKPNRHLLTRLDVYCNIRTLLYRHVLRSELGLRPCRMQSLTS